MQISFFRKRRYTKQVNQRNKRHRLNTAQDTVVQRLLCRSICGGRTIFEPSHTNDSKLPPQRRE